MGRLQVTLNWSETVVDQRVLHVSDRVRLGDHPKAAVVFPGADFVVRREGGAFCVRGRRLYEGQSKSIHLKDLRVDLEHVETRPMARQWGSQVDLRFLLIALGVTVSGMWLDTIASMASQPNGGFLSEQVARVRQFIAPGEARTQLGPQGRTAALQPGAENGELADFGEGSWDGPRAAPDDEKSGWHYYPWFRRAISHEVGDGVSGQWLDEAGLRAMLARQAYEADRWEEALPQYRWLVAQDPRNPTWLVGLAMAHRRLGMHRLEEAVYRQLLREDPDHLLALGYQAAALARLGRMDEADAAMDRVRARYPGHPYRGHFEALLSALQGREGDSLGALEVALEEHRALPESLQREMLRDLALEPALANLRADPRLAGLLERELGEGPRPRRP